jgi:tRNA pseudouridine55 synthase
MNGVLVVDKPGGMTSARVVARVKDALGAGKVGHTGTLDPFATGVLVCCINMATRLARFLTFDKKRYEGTMRLGVRTDTQDLTGHILSEEPEIGLADQDVVKAFRAIADVKHQTPPAYSAVKHKGVPLYKLAREGTFVQKPPRPITIYELEITDISLPYVRFEVCCSAGTYIRTLCADIGDNLGCGAHLTGLRRTESGQFTLDEAMSLDALERLSERGEIEGHVIPMGAALKNMPGISVDDELAERIRQGTPMTRQSVPPLGEETSPWVKATDARGHLVAVISSHEKGGIFPYACVFPGHGS